MGFGAKNATITTISTDVGRKYPLMDFWSSPADKIIIPSIATDLTFPSVVVSELPSGLTIIRAVLILTVRALYDSSGADNYINAAGKTLRVKESGGAWGLDDIVGITFDEDSLYTIGTYKESGPVIVGAHDIKTVVTGDGTYNVMSNETSRGDALVSLGDDLELYDVQTGIRVFFA